MCCQQYAGARLFGSVAHSRLRIGAVLALVAVAGPALAEDEPTIAQLLQAGVQQFQLGVEKTARALDTNPRLKGLSQEQRQGLVEFVAGNMLFVVVHEMGHVLITEMGLPVLGREEDAADAHAVLVMLKVGSAFSHRVLVGAAKGWFVSDQRERERGTKLAFYDEHGLDRQRAYQIVCLMVGSDPDKFGDLAEETKLPESRQGTCQGDYSNASWSWDMVLKPHFRAGRPKTKIDVVYGEGKGRLDIYAESFRSMRLLDIVAEVAAAEYAWRRPFTLRIQTCGSPDAHWDLSTQTLELCYEMAADFSQMYRDYVVNPANGRKRRTSTSR